jgi:hypothetical protein
MNKESTLQAEKFKALVLEEVMKKCGEPVNSILPIICKLNDSELSLIEDVVDILRIINKCIKED